MSIKKKNTQMKQEARVLRPLTRRTHFQPVYREMKNIKKDPALEELNGIMTLNLQMGSFSIWQEELKSHAKLDFKKNYVTEVK